MHLSKEELFDIFTVDFEGGHLFNRYDRNYNSRAGDLAGSITIDRNTNYRQVRVPKKLGEKGAILVKAHRVIYQMYYGNLTNEYVIDHIDGNGLNNSIHNLRKATRAQNSHNLITERSNNTSGVRGVSSLKSRNGNISYWLVRVRKGGQDVYQKAFRKDEYSLEQVAKIVEAQRKIHFGEYC